MEAKLQILLTKLGYEKEKFFGEIGPKAFVNI